MANDDMIATSSIHEAVKIHGGNGLSTPPFQPALNFLLFFGWVNVEMGVEALVCNGEILTKTKLKEDFLRIIGRRSFFHRVLIKPAPMEIKAQALSKDEIKVNLDVSMKYEVINPCYVASTQDPLLELSNLLIGVTAESIRKFDSHEIINADTQIKQTIETGLTASPIVADNYKIVEILKVMPTVDESLINIRKQTKEAKEKAGLIDAEGKNKERESLYNLHIASQEAELQEKQKKLDHDREIQKMKIIASTEIAKAGLDALGNMGQGGIDPRGVAKEFIGVFVPGKKNEDILFFGPVDEARQLSSGTNKPSSRLSQYDKENQALISIKEKLGIVSFEVLGSNEEINGAVIQFQDFEIVFICSPEYPNKQPDAVIRRSDGGEIYPEDYWIDGVTNLIAQVVGIVASQA